MQNKNVKTFTRFTIILALEAIVCFTPLGSLPAFGPVVATLGMLPVIVAAQTLGMARGAFMGFFAGLFSLIVWTFMPPNPALAFVFTPFMEFAGVSGGIKSVLVCVVPRVLVGVTASGLFRLFQKSGMEDKGAYAISGFCGSMVNTALVLGGIYFLFGNQYAEALGVGYKMLLGLIGTTVLTNGVPEAVLGVVTGLFVSRPLNKYFQ
ncbi:MAG: ECF transporter S component [Clostridiaceae bacterium]|nr:ECF transporter S component [Clostridiaceae bacterium]